MSSNHPHRTRPIGQIVWLDSPVAHRRRKTPSAEPDNPLHIVIGGIAAAVGRRGSDVWTGYRAPFLGTPRWHPVAFSSTFRARFEPWVGVQPATTFRFRRPRPNPTTLGHAQHPALRSIPSEFGVRDIIHPPSRPSPGACQSKRAFCRWPKKLLGRPIGLIPTPRAVLRGSSPPRTWHRSGCRTVRPGGERSLSWLRWGGGGVAAYRFRYDKITRGSADWKLEQKQTSAGKGLAANLLARFSFESSESGDLNSE